ncbi:hypothetical protein AMS68_007816 [Peltaster fructicola]|uniref:Uncharacterized protein n=1 Tax=Peltaster fructicola TaxID=286661 RepID=A0A6H0Y636_9PEZI|nr:hypothetical protein AMS68_007816 [Peltaster fructicola]
MAGCMLFCVSEEAKSATRQALNIKHEKYDVGHFFLVESRGGPTRSERFRMALEENDSFDTDFIGATPEDCQAWALERQRHDNKVDQDLIAIVDARSAKDGTLLVQKYYTLPEDCDALTFGGYGALPPERNVWYDFRVDHRYAGKVIAALTEVSPEVAYPIYYGNKDRFTNSDGVFDVQEADRFCRAEDADVKRSDIYRRKFET